MSNYEIGDLIFSGLNIAIALFSYFTGKSINKKRKEINNAINEFRNEIVKNNNLKDLGIIKEELKTLQKNLRSLGHSRKTEQNFNRKKVLNEYGNIIDKLDEIKNRISIQYSEIEGNVIDIKCILNNCIKDDKLLDEQDRDKADYNSVDTIFDSILRSVKKELEPMSLT